MKDLIKLDMPGFYRMYDVDNNSSDVVPLNSYTTLLKK